VGTPGLHSIVIAETKPRCCKFAMPRAASPLLSTT